MIFVRTWLLKLSINYSMIPEYQGKNAKKNDYGLHFFIDTGSISGVILILGVEKGNNVQLNGIITIWERQR